MVYDLVYTNQAEKDLASIGKSVAFRILKKVDSFLKLSNPMVKSKQLTGFDIPTYRFRVGDYRIVFRKDQKINCLVILVVLGVAHRKEVYRQF